MLLEEHGSFLSSSRDIEAGQPEYQIFWTVPWTLLPAAVVAARKACDVLLHMPGDSTNIESERGSSLHWVIV